MHEIDEVVGGLDCLVATQHHCIGCPYNPHPGMEWLYGCSKGQRDIVDDAKCLIKERSSKEHGCCNESENKLPNVEEERMDSSAWVKCSDRMPDAPGLYLCTVGASWRHVRIMEYKPREWRENENLWRTTGDDVDGYVFNWFVKAWMPLPKPYKEEGRENEE